MRFRFGWRKEQKSKKHIDETGDKYSPPVVAEEPAPADSEGNRTTPLSGQLAPLLSHKTRVLVFGDPDEMGNLYSLFLRFKGYEVLHFRTAATCALYSRQHCTCPRDHVCADIVLADMEMEGMTGLELIRQQSERGCHTSTWNKALLSHGLTRKQEHEAQVLGCKLLRKPFRLMDLLAWVRACEKYIPPGRKLTPYTELMTSIEECR